MSCALEVRDVRVALGRVTVLDGVDLEVEAGRVLGVLGPSGAGKSTLFRVISGEIAADAGSVHIGGRSADGMPLWGRAALGLGYVPQDPSVLWDLTVRQNLATFEQVTGKVGRPAHERAAEIGLEHRLDVRADELSGGERRRLEILRALVAEPSVLLCDEPFAAIDPARAGTIVDVLRGRASAGMAIVIADHRVGEALRVCDEVLLLADGKVHVRLAPEEFSSHPAVRERYLG